MKIQHLSQIVFMMFLLVSRLSAQETPAGTEGTSISTQAFTSTEKLESLLQPQVAKVLREDGYVFQYGQGGLEYINSFTNSQLQNDFQEIFYKTATNYMVQVLYFVPHSLLEESSRTNTEVYNAMTDLETLNNSYVVRDDRRDPFMTKVKEFSADNFKQEQKFQPLSSAEVPIFTQKYMRAKDTRFGTIKYTVDYRYVAGRFIVSMQNIDPISYLFYKISNAKQFTTVMTVQPLEDGLLYVLQAFTSIKDLGQIEKQIDLRTFFSRRLEAIKGWFFRQVYRLEVKQGIFPCRVEPDH